MVPVQGPGVYLHSVVKTPSVSAWPCACKAFPYTHRPYGPLLSLHGFVDVKPFPSSKESRPLLSKLSYKTEPLAESRVETRHAHLGIHQALTAVL
jgi:hypothetical protein